MMNTTFGFEVWGLTDGRTAAAAAAANVTRTRGSAISSVCERLGRRSPAN